MMNCLICGKELKSAKAFPGHLTAKHKLTTKQYYDKYLKKPDEGICLACGKETRFVNMSNGYKQFCSLKCATPHIQESLKATLKEKYNVTNFGQIPGARKKAKETMQERYNVDYFCTTEKCLAAGHTEEAKQKQKETCLRNYGVDCGFKTEMCQKASHSEEANRKRAETNLKKYGSKFPFKNNHSSDANAKRNATMQEKYNCTYAYQLGNSHSEEANAKRIVTNIKRFGCAYPMQSEEIRNKSKATNIKNFGVPYNLQAIEIREKIKQTNMHKYGVKCVLQLKDIQEKARIGVKSEEAKHKRHDTRLKNGWTRSKTEESFAEYLNKLNINFVYNKSTDSYPWRVDFYLPDFDLYIELNVSWEHGFHFYNEEIDKTIVKKFLSKNNEYYKNAVHIWTVSDIKKRNWAIEHNLNYVVLWNREQINRFLEELSQYKVFTGFIDYNEVII